jgi:hypothetical protein
VSIGALARKVLGHKIFPVIGRTYRSLFVDLEEVAQFMCNVIPKDSHILDIGGGDGEPLNYLMAMRYDIRVTLIDLKVGIGNSISKEFRDRVTLLPGTSMRQFIEKNLRQPTCIIINDVIHHIPGADRTGFFKDICDLMTQSKAILLIKDVEPGYFISRLGYLSDRYISGDRNVSLISKSELCLMLKNVFGKVMITETGLFSVDKPNYLLSITIC